MKRSVVMSNRMSPSSCQAVVTVDTVLNRWLETVMWLSRIVGWRHEVVTADCYSRRVNCLSTANAVSIPLPCLETRARTGEYHIYRSPTAISNNILQTAVYPASICASGVVTRARFYYLIPLVGRLALFSDAAASFPRKYHKNNKQVGR